MCVLCSFDECSENNLFQLHVFNFPDIIRQIYLISLRSLIRHKIWQEKKRKMELWFSLKNKLIKKLNLQLISIETVYCAALW